ncbi:MAG: hypothetical protein JJU29_11390 [Verrucomicrobia bacterium]|nr:hypothetical protein [Verrucomicrobiota bacterium]MCH8514118.1 DUF4435 domain-containing protein [Kiritimatiellia bacterium]
MKIIQGVDASRALQSAQHKLFVEGSSDEEIDPIVIAELLLNSGLPQVEVRPMGGCENVRSAAWAMVRHHPSYYFVIDRDDQSDQQVEDSWTSFPDADNANLIIWRKRELENYFIDPNYISQSNFLKKGFSKNRIAKVVLKEANRRLFLDAANLTLLSLHRDLRRPFCDHFANPADFQTIDDGRSRISELPELSDKVADITRLFSKSHVETLYDDFVNVLTGGAYPLMYGTGDWLTRMSGKEIFRAIAGQCFTVRSRTDEVIQGKEQNIEVAKDLLRLPLAQQPSDFQELVDKVRQRISAI